jgi:hypothetical protein
MPPEELAGFFQSGQNSILPFSAHPWLNRSLTDFRCSALEVVGFKKVMNCLRDWELPFLDQARRLY